MGTGSSIVSMTGSLFSKYYSVEEFGEKLLITGDLDPIYIMLHRASFEGMKRPLLARWLLAYWWFYHAGVASQLADSPQFYETAKGCAIDGAPRGVERRHFRGTDCLRSIIWFKHQYETPEKLLDVLESRRSFAGVKQVVLRWPAFGPWMAFKIADMLERICEVPIVFRVEDVLGFYDKPRETAKEIAKERGMKDEFEAVDYLLTAFSSFGAPPSNNRRVGLQEVETILCKWDSHRKGNYPIGKDTKEIREHLEGFGPLADRLARYLP